MFQNNVVEELEKLLMQIEEITRMTEIMKHRVEEVLANNISSKVVREKESSYQAHKASEYVLMPDFLLDENGKAIDVEYTLVKWK